MNAVKRALRTLGRPLWRRVWARIEARIASIELRLKNSEIQIESRMRNVELHTINQEILEFRIDELRKRVRADLAAEIYLVRQELEDKKADIQGIIRDCETFLVGRQTEIAESDSEIEKLQSKIEAMRSSMEDLRGQMGERAKSEEKEAEGTRSSIVGLRVQMEERAKIEGKETEDIRSSIAGLSVQIEGRTKADEKKLEDMRSSIAGLRGQMEERAKTEEKLEAALREARSKIIADWVLEEWQYLQPKDVVGMEFTRVGRRGDGGYVMVDDFVDCRYALSFGVGTEISWDLAIVGRGLTVFLYDQTIDSIPVQHEKLKLRRFGLGESHDPKGAKQSLPKILSHEGLQDDSNLILKIDVEGAEWKALRQIAAQEMQLFRQIVVEFHGLADYSDHDKHIERLYTLKKMAETHQVVHVHANNWGRYVIIGGIPVPDVVEVTFARATYRFADCTRVFPTGLDSPNNSDRAELIFRGPLLSASA